MTAADRGSRGGKAIALLALCLASGLAGAFVATHWRTDSSAHADGRAHRPESGDWVAELRAVKQELAVLSFRQAATEIGARQGSAAPAAPAAPARSREEAQAEIVAALESGHAGGGRDATAAREAVTRIEQVLTAALPGASVGSGSCNERLCRIVIEHAQPETQDGLANELLEADALETEAFYAYDRTSTPPRTTIYLARAAERLPLSALR